MSENDLQGKHSHVPLFCHLHCNYRKPTSVLLMTRVFVSALPPGRRFSLFMEQIEVKRLQQAVKQQLQVIHALPTALLCFCPCVYSPKLHLFQGMCRPQNIGCEVGNVTTRTLLPRKAHCVYRKQSSAERWCIHFQL